MTIWMFILSVYATFLELVDLVRSTVYDLLVSNNVTTLTYEKLVQRINQQSPKPKKILDVGVGTGVPLSEVLQQLPADTQVVGIDIDHSYLFKARKLFRNSKQVRLIEMNFYQMSTDEKFDAILFTSSFLLMEDPLKALNLAKQLLAPEGRIYFIVTLNDKPLLERITHKIKELTSLDLETTRDTHFEELITQGNLVTIHKERLKKIGNVASNILRVFMYETKIL